MILAGALVIQVPQVQTAIVTKVTDSLSEKLDGDISIEKIHFKPFSTLVLKNLVITDKNPQICPTDSTLAQIDTFFRSEYVIVKLSLAGLLDEESIKIRSAVVRNAQMNLVLEDLMSEADTVIMYNNLSRIFRIDKDKERKEPRPDEIFRIKDVKIEDMGFVMKNYSTMPIKRLGGGIDWNDLNIHDICVNARDLAFKNGIMSGKADKISFREETGFVVSSMSGEARVGRGRTIIDNLRIKDQWSDLHLSQFMMSYRNVDDFKDFIRLVKLDGKIEKSIIDFRTIANFAPQIKGVTLRADVSGAMSGVVEDFKVSDIKFSSQEGGFSGTVNGRMTGIPETYLMGIDAKVTGLRLTTEGLSRFVTQWMRGGRLDLGRFAEGTTFYGTASAKGPLNNLDTKAALTSKVGKVQAQVRLDEIIRPDAPITISGTVETADLNIGQIIGNDLFGPATLNTRLSMTVDDGISVDMDSLRIRRLNLKGYDYSDILAKGKYDPNTLNATVISKDPNLNFIFQGGYARSEKSRNTVYKINASVGHADLNAINIDRRGKSMIQLRTNADFTKTANGNILGRIDVGEILLENKSGRYDVGDVIMTSYSTGDRYTARLNSQFASASFSGTASIIDFIKDIKGITIDRELPVLNRNEEEYTWNGNSYEASLTCHNIQNLLSFAAPGLYIENGTSLKTQITPDGDMTVNLNSGRMAVRRNYLKGIDMTLDNLNQVLKGEIHCQEASIADIQVTDNLIQLYANDNRIGAGYSFDNHTDNETSGEFIVNGQISGDEDNRIIELDIKPSSLKYNSKEWSIQPSSIRIEGSDISVDSFGAISGEEFISLNGRASENYGDILSLQLERFDLSAINSILPSDFGVRGAVTGLATLSSPISSMNLDIDMLCDSSYVANIPIGVVRLGTEWNDEDRCFEFFGQNELGGVHNIDIKGHYTPKSRMLDANFDLDRFQIGYAQPFLKDIFSQMNGNISGSISASGPLDMLKIRSRNTVLKDATLKIGYTGVPYFADGPFHMDETGVYFDDISIRDRYNGTGTVSGSINYNYFKDIRFDTRINVEQIEGICLDEKDNDVFYGNIFATGDLHLTGPLKSLVMNINASTAKAGNLHIPTDYTSIASKGTNLLKFKQLETTKFIDPYEIFVQKTTTEEITPNEFLVRLNVAARPSVEAFVEIDKSSGNVLSGRGSGNISLEAGEDIFKINGDYTIEEGNYKFVAMGIVKRDFQIQEGSTIRFNGDILDSDLDIDAIYKTKASISTLISDTTSVANRRLVECGIRIQDKLISPQLSFSIEIPDLDPTIKSRVESALSTEDKVQKQFLALIVSNNFLPDEQSGIVNNTSALYSNMTEMVANQINNIFQKLNIPLDLGLRYQPNTRGNDIFDVAVTTQLFNNRVVVNGNIGNKQYSSGNTENEVVGDIDIEIKLDRSGSFRLNLFSHSADQYTNYLDNSQRNGVGITYQTEFNTFRQFFRNMFTSRKKRQEARLAEEQAMRNTERTVIEIK
ncbi:MAG: hypothetical protein E7111_01215 [Bacteroidales bacterium]|nr:hypothetical protein [Bacteroidales bacterium]